jgi:hypothetical protein
MKCNLCYISHVTSKTLETDILLYIWGIYVENVVERAKYLRRLETFRKDTINISNSLSKKKSICSP